MWQYKYACMKERILCSCIPGCLDNDNVIISQKLTDTGTPWKSVPMKI